MSLLERFEDLAHWARREQAPAIDVSWRVLRAIRTPRPWFEVYPPVPAVAAGLSLVAAPAVAASAVEYWLAWSDPILGLIQSVTRVLQ